MGGQGSPSALTGYRVRAYMDIHDENVLAGLSGRCEWRSAGYIRYSMVETLKRGQGREGRRHGFVGSLIRLNKSVLVFAVD